LTEKKSIIDKILKLLIYILYSSEKRLIRIFFQKVENQLLEEIINGKYKWIILNILEFLPLFIHIKEKYNQNLKIHLDLHEVNNPEGFTLNIIKYKNRL
jgi:hypothetical protein